MKPPPFEYIRAETEQHAVETLARFGGEARLLAGGQSLIPMMNLRLARPAALVDIGRLPLGGISAAPGEVVIGALARHGKVLASQEIASVSPVVPKAMRHVAHPTIRNLGTAGGSVAYADPTAEFSALLTLLDGEVMTRSPSGSRTIAASDFFRGAFETALRDDEMVLALRFRPPAGRHGSAFLEVSERQGDYAIAAVGVTLTVAGGAIRETRIVLSGAESRPSRASESERSLIGRRLDPRTIREAARIAVAGRASYADIRATAVYRRSLLEALTARALEEAWKEAT